MSVGAMIIARAVGTACFTVLKWMLLAIGALLVLLTIVQAMRGDADTRPMVTMMLGFGSVMTAFTCGWIASKIETMA